MDDATDSVESVESVDDVAAGWTSDARAGRRRRIESLTEQAAEDGTLVGVAADLAEQAAEVVVTAMHGARHIGRIIALNPWLLCLRDERCRVVVLAVREVVALRTAPRRADPGALTATVGPWGLAGDRDVPAAGARRLGEVLSGWVDERPLVRVVHRGGVATTGELRRVGRDVATLRLDGGGGEIYVALGSLAEVSLESG